MNILYIEDNAIDAELTRLALKRTEFRSTLVVAPTCQEGLDKLKSGEVFDVVLSDMRLPDGTAFNVLSWVREITDYPAFVVITGQGDEEIAVSVLKAGADDYLTKSTDALKKLPAVLEDAVHRHRNSAARQEHPLRVVYVEHNPIDIDLTRRHIARFTPFILLDVTYSIIDAMNKLEKGCDVFLLDYQMPGINALDVIKEVRQVRELDIPIVLVTGLGSEEIALAALKLGAAEYVVKNTGYLYQLPSILENAYHQAELIREEKALYESERRFRLLAENAQDIIFRIVFRPEPVFEYVSPAVERITGYSPQELYKDPEAIYKLYHPDDRSTLSAIFRDPELLRKTSTQRWVRKNGTNFWVELRNVPNVDENGKPVSFEGIARDVTEAILAEQQIRRQLQQLSALRDIDIAITAHTAQKEVLDILLDSVTYLLGVDAVDIYLLDAGGSVLQFADGKGFRHEPAQSISLMSRKNYAGLVVQEQRTVRVSTSSVQTLEEGFTRMMVNENFVSYVGTPLVTNDQVIGVMEVFHRMPLQTDAEWINFFETLAGQAAIAIDNTHLIADLQTSNERLIQAYDLTLEGWVRALDLRDKETEGHTQRVAEMTLQLAVQMGFKEEELKSIRRGALLHDIGKIGIPDSILLKPGELTADEWIVMKKHPSFAFDLIHPIPYLSETLDIPYCHHEKWNGSGYPRGLKGEEIPLAARIFAVIDVWDALLSDRPYRKSWSKEKTIHYLREQAGIHFDPEVVKVFIDWVDGRDAR